MSLLPSRGPETSTHQDGEFEVVGVDEDVAPVLDALASDTAREVLNEIYENPGTPSEIADRLDMSIQKVAYHLEKLEDVDLIAVAGTRYSAKGQEMTVYEPPDEPLVLFVGTEERKSRLRSLVRRVVPTVSVLALGGLLVQGLFGAGGSVLPFGATPHGGDGTSGGDDVAYSGDGGGNGDGAGSSQDAVTDSHDVASARTETAESAGPEISVDSSGTPVADGGTPSGSGNSAESMDMVTDAVGQSGQAVMEPGVAFFLGGLLVLCVVAGLWYYRG